MLVATDVGEGHPVVFDSYEKEDGRRKSEYGPYTAEGAHKGFEYAITYEDGIEADFVMASASVPVNYDYTRLKVEDRHSVQLQRSTSDSSSGNVQLDVSSNFRPFWDGGLLANTALRNHFGSQALLAQS